MTTHTYTGGLLLVPTWEEEDRLNLAGFTNDLFPQGISAGDLDTNKNNILEGDSDADARVQSIGGKLVLTLGSGDIIRINGITSLPISSVQFESTPPIPTPTNPSPTSPPPAIADSMNTAIIAGAAAGGAALLLLVVLLSYLAVKRGVFKTSKKESDIELQEPASAPLVDDAQLAVQEKDGHER